jgi:hypothetical protein
LVAVIAVLPSFVPFLLFYNNPALAIRASNVVSFVVLFFLAINGASTLAPIRGAPGCCSPPLLASWY